MPHVIYLHSALQASRVQAARRGERRALLAGNKWDCIVGLGLAGLVNLAMLCIAAALFHRPGLTGISDLGPVHAHLATLAGGGAALAFGVAVMASGLASSSVGTYSGQVVMAGFMNWQIPLLARRALTMLPSLTRTSAPLLRPPCAWIGSCCYLGFYQYEVALPGAISVTDRPG